MVAIGKYRKKIKSAKNIAKITKAMQLVAASKMKRAQYMALSGKEYADGVSDLASILSKHLDKKIHPLISDHVNPQAYDLLIVVAPEKGLCGGLVTNLGRFVLQNTGDTENIEVVAIGNKAKQITRRLGLTIAAEFPLGLSYPVYDMVPPIARFIEEKFTAGEVKSVKIVYAEFVNTMEQNATFELLLPLSISEEEKAQATESKEYLFEPSGEEIVSSLLKMYLEVKIYHILLEAYASEQSARMVAMKNATDNAKSLIEQLTIEFNKVRQAGITSEILDVGNAAAAVS